MSIINVGKKNIIITIYSGLTSRHPSISWTEKTNQHSWHILVKLS